MKVYHGGIQEIRFPLVKVGRPNLDFGQGFYVTDIRVQAERWAEHEYIADEVCMELQRGYSL